MRRIVVFPVRGRRWALGVAEPPSDPFGAPPAPEPTLLRIWQKARDEAVENARQGKGILRSAWNSQWNMGVITQHLVDKLLRTAEKKWVALGQTPEGSVRKRIHSMGEQLLSRINPTETFLRSVPKDVVMMEIVFPSSLNPRLVRRRVRQIAMSGVQVHSWYMYGSFVLLPFSILFSIVPVPNAPLFWNLYRAYANWQALQGSRILFQFVNDDSRPMRFEAEHPVGQKGTDLQKKLVLLSCERLDSIMRDQSESLSDSCISSICEQFRLERHHILKWRDYVFKRETELKQLQ